MAAKEIVLSAPRNTPDLRKGSVFFVGNATVVIHYAGFTILTDPNFLHKGDHVHLGYGLTAKRLLNPAVEIDELPPLDVCVLSHMHEDHWDEIAEQRLPKTLPIVTTNHAAAKLKKQGFRAPVGLKTWDTRTFRKGDVRLSITSMPGKHGPGPMAKILPPVMGSLLDFQGPTGKTLLRLYISGDTLMHGAIKEIPERYPDIDLALLHLGGTRALGIYVTMDAKQGVEMIKMIDPTLAIPIHYNDYSRFKSSLDDFKRQVKKAGLEEKVRYLSHGDTYTWKVPDSRTK